MRKFKTALSFTLCAGLFISSAAGVKAQVKADPLLNTKNANYQYQFDDINVMKAWKLLKKKGYTKTKVGVMDTGVDSLHEDLKKNLKEYVRISKGAIKKAVADADTHGTHVSGIIAATYGNGKGGAGVATGFNNYMVALYVAGVKYDDGSINDVDLIKAIEYFKEKGVKVVNMSLGGYSYDDNIHKAMKAAYDAGITLVAASGNDDTNKDSSPASFDEVISVNSSDSDNQTSYFSNYGFTSDISAPVQVLYRVTDMQHTRGPLWLHLGLQEWLPLYFLQIPHLHQGRYITYFAEQPISLSLEAGFLMINSMAMV